MKTFSRKSGKNRPPGRLMGFLGVRITLQEGEWMQLANSVAGEICFHKIAGRMEENRNPKRVLYMNLRTT